MGSLGSSGTQAQTRQPQGKRPFGSASCFAGCDFPKQKSSTFIVKISPVAKEHLRPLEKAKQINQPSPLPFFFFFS